MKNKKNKNKPVPVEEDRAEDYYVASPSYDSSWMPALGAGAWAGAAKGFDNAHQPSALIGNGRFCWNCYARASIGTTAYANCFTGQQAGYLEMCTGEEYFCMWNERRQNGMITAVGGGCKAAHSCMDQMTENFTWQFQLGSTPIITGDNCRAGLNWNWNGDSSICSWCCDGMVSNRFAPTNLDLCNHEDYNSGAFDEISTFEPPAAWYKRNGDTEQYPWFANQGSYAARGLYSGLYADGQYHRLFMIALQTAIGDGI